MTDTATPQTVILTPKQIASWFQKDSQTSEILAPITASIPKLQRGLVWNPSQIELLWDSLLRGFPIGSLVVCPRIPGQDDGENPSVTHHLLDGQQRSHAISLGYVDPFANMDPEVLLGFESILWIDLQPAVPVGSTREFVVRITTSAHPWGFRLSDQCQPLHARQIRNILKCLGRNPGSPDYKRPSPSQLHPVDAVAPVPLAWLTLSEKENEDQFWNHIRNRCEGLDAPWAKKSMEFLDDASEIAVNARQALFAALQGLRKTSVVALPAPESLVKATRSESTSAQTVGENSAIEQLFQRLNRQGTRLDGEELAYSMIKAYWPQVAKPVSEIEARRMPASRLVMIAARAALTPTGAERLRGPLSVSDIRSLASKRDLDAAKVLGFIDSRLKACCDWIENALLYDHQIHPEGLLPVHLANIARQNPDVYLLLIRIADIQLATGAAAEPLEALRPALIAMVMRLSWFSNDSRKAANHIFAACRERVSADALRQALDKAEQDKSLLKLPTPEELSCFLGFEGGGIESWTWHTPIYGDGEEIGRNGRQQYWGAFFHALGNRDLLLYAQRAFMDRRFAEYDPSRRDLWEGHNRPWDFDHIHAQSLVNNLKADNRYQRFVKQWLDTLGNLRAWPFEDNRSDSDESAYSKITSAEQLSDSFLLPDELEPFSLGRKPISDEVSARSFASACRKRLVRIYKECWNRIA